MRSTHHDYLNAVADLARMLQPVTDPASDPTLRRRLRWSSLELTNPTTLPGFSWDMRSNLQGAGAVNTFRFDPGAWTLLLTDQPPRVASVSPRGVLMCSPEVDVSIDATDATRLNASVRAPGSSAPPALAAGSPQLTYTATSAAGAYTETIAVQNVLMTYSALDAASQIPRAVANLPDPQLDNPDPPDDPGLLAGATALPTLSGGTIDPPVLFGTVPMEDGWAQLPFLNVTEQILIDGLPEQIAPPVSGPLLMGAASFGTDRARAVQPGLRRGRLERYGPRRQWI